MMQSRFNALDKGPDHLRLGVWGENVAATYLQKKGYCILERDWHSTHRDIDIIAQQGEVIVFVEVKTRRSNFLRHPIQAVDWKKQQNLRKAINHYIHYRKIDGPVRFDVITVIGELESANPEIEHIEDFALALR